MEDDKNNDYSWGALIANESTVRTCGTDKYLNEKTSLWELKEVRGRGFAFYSSFSLSSSLFLYSYRYRRSKRDHI